MNTKDDNKKNRTFSMDNLKGELRNIHFPELLRAVAMTQTTGILTIKREKIEKRIYFRNGFIVFASSNYLKDRLGNILLQKGVISEAQLKIASDKFKEYKGQKKLGSILTELGFVDAKNLANHIRLQVTRIIYSLFYWNAGQFAFEQQIYPLNEVQLQFTVGDLIISCIRSIKIRDLLINLLPDSDFFLVKSSNPFIRYQKIRLNPDEKQIMDIIDGTKKISDIMDYKHFQKIDIVRALCGLIYAGLIETSSKPSERGEVEELLNDAFDSFIKRAFPGEQIEDQPVSKPIETTGELSSVFLPEFFMNLVAEKKTGVLECIRDDVKKTIYFHRGKTVYAESDAPFEQLIPLLILAGKLTEDQAEEAFKIWEKRSTEWQGTVLMELGYLDFEELDWPFQLQAKEITSDLLTWEEGTYLFKEGSLPDTAYIIAELSVPEIIIDSIRRMEDYDVINRRLPPSNAIPSVLITDIEELERLPLTAFELDVLKLVDAERTISEISEASHFKDSEVKVLFLILLLLNVVEISDMGDEGLPEPHKEKEQADIEQLSATEVSKSRIEKQKERITQFYEKVKSSKNPYSLLGLSRDSLESQIEAAYHYLIREFHLDKIVGTEDEDLVMQNQTILKTIAAAYAQLIDPNERQKLDAVLDETEQREAPVDEQTIALENEGDSLLTKGQYSEALQKYMEALRQSSYRTEILAKIAFVYAFYEGKYRDAKKYCRKAIERKPDEATYHALMSSICRCSGLNIVAKQAIKQAMTLDNSNNYANEEERFININNKVMTDQQREGFFTHLLECLNKEK